MSSGGAGVSEGFVAEATRALGARVKRTYGSTEAPTVITDGRTIADGRTARSIGDDGELLRARSRGVRGLPDAGRQR